MPVPLKPVPSATPATPAAFRQPTLSVPRTHVGAVWTGLSAGVVVVALLVVFLLQNTTPVPVAFLGMHGAAPLALMLLMAGCAVVVLALAVGFLRRDRLRRYRPAGRLRAAPTSRQALS